MLTIHNKAISTDIMDILKAIKSQCPNKLKHIINKTDNILVTCPFHKNGQENNPSCYIYINDNHKLPIGSFHCFTCKEKGDFITFTAGCFECNKSEAASWLKENFADTLIEQYEILPEINLCNEKKSSATFLSTDILKQYDFYHPYMQHRKLTKEVIDLFNVGYNPKTECITFPVFDENNNLVMITQRSVKGKYFYIPAQVEKPVYGLNIINKYNITTAVVTESQINCLYAYSLGFPAIALFGTGSQHQYDILNKCNITSYILCFDGDEAGDSGIKRFMKNIRKDVIVTTCKIPRGKDLNDLSPEEATKIILQNS